MTRKIYFNGNIITVDKKESIAQAILVEDNLIKAVGTNEEILNLADNSTEKIDLEGKTMLPGFIDPHGHIVAIAQTLMIVMLGDVTSKEELLNRLKKELKENPVEEGKWLIGFGYDNTKFEDGLHPTKFDLDTVSTEVPITVSHASGHLACVNSKALELYGYAGEDYVVPEGGVVRTVSPDSKEANGVLEENAILDSEKKKVVPSPGFEDVLNAIVKAQKLYASLGVTTTQDASVEEANHYNHMLGACAQNNMLFIDIVGLATQPSTKNLMKDEGTPKREYFNHYKLGGAKTWLDGSPQGFTALVNFNADASVEENEQALMESLTMVKSGQVTFAVRDTVMNDVEVKEGNIIGIAESKLMDAGDSVNEITTSLVEKLVDEDSAIITLFYGEDVTEEDANNLRDELEEKFEDLDIELYYGCQPLYYYLISVE